MGGVGSKKGCLLRPTRPEPSRAPCPSRAAAALRPVCALPHPLCPLHSSSCPSPSPPTTGPSAPLKHPPPLAHLHECSVWAGSGAALRLSRGAQSPGSGRSQSCSSRQRTPRLAPEGQHFGPTPDGAAQGQHWPLPPSLARPGAFTFSIGRKKCQSKEKEHLLSGSLKGKTHTQS